MAGRAHNSKRTGLNTTWQPDGAHYPARNLHNLIFSPLERMRELECHLAQVKPHTMLLVYELLGMCVTILAHEHPEDTLACGPVPDIVRNVMSSLGSCKPETRIGGRRWHNESRGYCPH
jgi:hypothetical protein